MGATRSPEEALVYLVYFPALAFQFFQVPGVQLGRLGALVGGGGGGGLLDQVLGFGRQGCSTVLRT